jgi:hypothetical protein
LFKEYIKSIDNGALYLHHIKEENIRQYWISELCPFCSILERAQCFKNWICCHPQVRMWGVLQSFKFPKGRVYTGLDHLYKLILKGSDYGISQLELLDFW